MSKIILNLPHVFHAGVNPEHNAKALRRLLDLMVQLNLDYLRDHPDTPDLYRSGVVYARTCWWEPIPAFYERKKADCKSLAPARSAFRIRAGYKSRPVFRYNAQGQLYHILCEDSELGFDDPSKVLGMGNHELVYYAC
jgi:hypothetical protein